MIASSAGEPVVGVWDAARLDQVVTNLLSNAIRYGAGKPIEVRVANVGAMARISVRDHGIGIPHDKQGRLFERFYRAHVGTPYAHATSMGVGLYLSNEFVSRHGGEMWFESTEGVGSRFALGVPITAPPSEEAR